MTDNAPRIVNVHLETTCEAEIETVWQTLVDDINQWWGAPYVSSDERVSLTLDAQPGGLLFEDWSDGNGRAWASVRALRRPHLIEFDGTFMMNGALHGTATIAIEAAGEGTSRIVLTQQAIGVITDETIAAWNGGWTDLLTSLKDHCERRNGAAT